MSVLLESSLVFSAAPESVVSCQLTTIRQNSPCEMEEEGS